MIIGISGYAGSGKDTVGGILQDLLQKPIDTQSGFPSWVIKKFAEPLRRVAAVLLGLTEFGYARTFTSEFKDPKLGPEWDYMTGREFLQRLGTDAIRDNLHKNAWVNAIFANYTDARDWIITDMRFPNEMQAIKERNGITIRVDRPGVTAVNAHPSETSLDNAEFDYRINNDGTIEELTEKVRIILKDLKLI